ncbi:tetratricopeptide repeat protein, partial [Candidatus Poribacteria bacterium]|nr:tetratricopeptide repeat protein [Candidatus Poribacteria bacterium]
AQFEIGFITYSLGTSNENKYLEAITEYSKVLQNYPASEYTDDALFEIGRCYQLLGKHDKEEEALQKLVQSYPNSDLADNALLRIAEIHFDRIGKGRSLEERQRVESAYNQIIQKYPSTESEAIARFQLGSIFYKFDGNFQASMVEFGACTNIIDNLLSNVLAGKYVPSDLDVATISNLSIRSNFWQAESMFRLAKQSEDQAQPSDSVKRAYSQARGIYQELLNREARLKKDFPEKTQNLREIMEGDKLDIPVITETYYMISRCLYKEGNLSNAKASLQLIKSPEKIRLKAEILLANIAFDLGQLSEARSLLEVWENSKLLQEVPDEFNAEIQVLSAKIELSAGNVNEAKTMALDTWALFQSINGLWEEPAYIVAKCYQQQNDIDRAKSWFEKLDKSSSPRWRMVGTNGILSLKGK